MKKLIAFLLIPFFASAQVVVNTGNHRKLFTAPPASFVVTNTAKATGSGTTLALPAFSTALTNPSLIVVHHYSSSSAFSAPTDTAGNTYVDCGPGQLSWGSFSVSFQCWYALNTHTTASNVVTLHYASSTSFAGGGAFEITGANTSTPIDGGSGVGYNGSSNATAGAAGANSMTCASITPASNGDMIIAFFGANSGPQSAGTSPNAFTLFLGTWAPSEYFIQTTAAAITATEGSGTSSDPYGCVVTAIKH